MGGERQLYVYGLTVPGLPAKLTVLRHPLRTLRLSGIEAIVEPMTSRPEPTIESLQTQQEIVTRLAARVPALVPARFGSIMKEASLRSLVETQHDAIAAALRRVTGCAQMTIRVFGTSDLPAPAVLRAASGTAFLEQRRARAHYLPAEVDVIRTQLGRYVREERVEPGARTLRVTVFHLVARESVDEYRQRAEDLHSMLPLHQVTVTGPAPAFAFAPELL